MPREGQYLSECYLHLADAPFSRPRMAERAMDEVARIIWALLVKGGTYRTPAAAA